MPSDGRSAYDASGAGLALFALDADPLPFAAAAARLGIPLPIVADTRAAGRAAWERGLILVRPDQFVAWSADARDESEAVLCKAVGRPGARPSNPSPLR